LDLSFLRKNIAIVFQPIHNLVSGEILGFEALTRGPAGPLHCPSNLFKVAAREKILDKVELLCFSLALKEAALLQPQEKMIFFNFSPYTTTKHYGEIISRLGDAREKTVIELIEYAVIGKARGELLTALDVMHSAGLKIALDDVGNGDRDFTYIAEIPADIMKLDRWLIHGLTKNKSGNAPKYKIILPTLVGLAQELKMLVIAEGIETEMQHAGILSAGINLAQGYYLSKPKPALYWANEFKKGDVRVASGR